MCRADCQLEALLVQLLQLRVEFFREPVELAPSRPQQLELALDERDRVVEDAKPLCIVGVALPLVSQRGARLFCFGKPRQLLEREAEQVAKANELLDARDVGLAIRAVR